jgi:hypothetical protein
MRRRQSKRPAGRKRAAKAAGTKPLPPVVSMKNLCIVGLDAGRDYFAWATLKLRRRVARMASNKRQREINNPRSWILDRSGFIFLPKLGKDEWFGTQLPLLKSQLETLLLRELKADIVAAERFTYRPGGGGGISEIINLQLGCLAHVWPSIYLVRNAEWKTWLRRTLNRNSDQVFLTSSQHESDAAGIALYAACRGVEKRAAGVNVVETRGSRT